MGIVILCAGIKGGTGKTTTTYNLGTLLVEQGFDVLFVDTDDQENLNNWAAMRETVIEEQKAPFHKLRKPLAPLNVVQKSGENIRQWLARESEKHDVTLVDAGGYDSPEMRDGLLVADIWLIPCTVDAFTVQTFKTLDQLVRQANGFRTRPLQGLVFATHGDTGDLSYDRDTLRSSLGQLDNFVVLSTVIRHRKIFKRCANNGVGVNEWPRYSEAERKTLSEVSRLLEESLSYLPPELRDDAADENAA
jgi:chromosome partitioning protein